MPDSTTPPPEAVRLADVRVEPFVRMEPWQARLAAQALESVAGSLRTPDGDDAARTAYRRDVADRAESTSAYLHGWADAWDPGRQQDELAPLGGAFA